VRDEDKPNKPTVMRAKRGRRLVLFLLVNVVTGDGIKPSYHAVSIEGDLLWWWWQ
jgi:hypothetical protein